MRTGPDVYSTNILVWNDYKELLVVSRKDDNTKFTLPGGKVDLCDFDDYYRTEYYKSYTLKSPDLNTLRRAASRELKEETSVFIRPDDLQPVFTSKHDWKDYVYECTSFFGISDQEPRAIEPGTWVGWRSPEQLVDPAKNPFYNFMVELFESIGVR